jgi:uracil-xanthine permease
MAQLWTLHGDGRKVLPNEVVSPDERLAWPQTIGLGMQHVLAMFGATFLVPVLTGFPPTTTIFFSGIGTIAFILITRGRGQRMGLPSYLGSSFAFISPVIIAEGGVGKDIPAALGGILVCGAVLFIIGAFVNRFGSKAIEWLMPPAVTGAVVALIGLNLAPTAAGEFSAQALTAFLTLAAILLFTVLLRGFVGRISILLGVVLGYIVAIPQGQISFDAVKSAAWLGLPTFNHPTFSGKAVLVIVPVVLVLIAENTGHIKAVASMTGRNLDKSLGRGYMGDGLATMLAGLGGGSGTTTYAENIGVMAATKVYSTAAYIVAGLFAICLGFIPKFGALIFSLPVGVLGGATTVLYGLIAVLGARIWVENHVDFKNPVNLMPAAIALIIGAANYTWAFSVGGNAFAFNGIAMGSFTCIFAYQVMKYLARYGLFRGGEPQPEPVTPASGPMGGTPTAPSGTVGSPTAGPAPVGTGYTPR